MSSALDLDSIASSTPHDTVPDGRLASAVISGGATAAVGVAGLAFGATALTRHLGPVSVDRLIPLTRVDLEITPVGGLFMAVTGAVAVAVGIYLIGYARREHLPAGALIMAPLFVAALLAVTASGSVSTFLLCWELMAVTSLVLVLTEHRRAEARDAGVIYAVLTQLGFLALLLGLLVLSFTAGTDSFTAIAARADELPASVRNGVFVLTLIGFGSKAGLLPLHAWLPRAHPEAPSPVSALMSAAMVNMGIYGIVRVDLQLLGPTPRWQGLTLLAIGGLSAIFGALHASVATDLKRLLAYSTTENMGFIAIALGTAMVLRSSGTDDVAVIALTAALLHVIAHAAFKTLAFLAAGAVLAGTGLRDLDQLGGLAKRMPATTVFFGIAALGACGLPLGAGFVSEWLLVQSLIHGPHQQKTLMALTMPLALGAVALTTGLAVAAMVKALGVGFLARPRSRAAQDAREASPTMVVGMGLAGLACVSIAVAPLLVGPALIRVLDTLPAGRSGHQAELRATLRLPGVAGSIAPGWLAAALIVAMLTAGGLARWGSRRRPTEETKPTWACGALGLSPRMQYTATSFAEPLQRVFDDVLRPSSDVQVTPYAESRYLVEKITYRGQVVDAIEQHLYAPLTLAVRHWAGWVRRAHNGNVHLYLAYGAVGLLVVLVVAQ